MISPRTASQHSGSPRAVMRKPEPARLALVVLVADQEDVPLGLLPVQDVQPVVGDAFDHFEGGRQPGVGGQDGLDLARRWAVAKGSTNARRGD